jgi:hypothetical protein
VEQTQELLQRWDDRARRLYPRMEIIGEGLMLGAGTVLAGMAKDERGRPRLALGDEPRAMARRPMSSPSSLISSPSSGGLARFGTRAKRRFNIFI